MFSLGWASWYLFLKKFICHMTSLASITSSFLVFLRSKLFVNTFFMCNATVRIYVNWKISNILGYFPDLLTEIDFFLSVKISKVLFFSNIHNLLLQVHKAVSWWDHILHTPNYLGLGQSKPDQFINIVYFDQETSALHAGWNHLFQRLKKCFVAMKTLLSCLICFLSLIIML